MSSVDVTDASFATDVVEKSRELPVLVDFWAPWCGPCRNFTPILERVVAESNGAVALAKINIDENPHTARDFAVQSIPAVKIFKDGAMVGEFTGAQPEKVMRDLVDKLAPSEADLLVEKGDEASVRKALELDPNHVGATLAVARLEHEAGDSAAALELLGRLPDTAEVSRLRAEIEVTDVDPDDAAQVALAAGDHRQALEIYLGRLAGPGKEDARQAILRVFTLLGDQDPLTLEFRPRLARALF